MPFLASRTSDAITTIAENAVIAKAQITLESVARAVCSRNRHRKHISAPTKHALARLKALVDGRIFAERYR
jgi:hypothetical protein